MPEGPAGGRRGIEVVTERAFEPIEAGALAWFDGFAARVARGEAQPRPVPTESIAPRAEVA
jgi:hypothetical protein